MEEVIVKSTRMGEKNNCKRRKQLEKIVTLETEID